MLTDFAFLPAPWRSRHISYDDGVGEFSTTAVKLKAINFCAIHLIKEEKKRMGNLYFSTLAIIEKNGRRVRERAEHVENMAEASST